MFKVYVEMGKKANKTTFGSTPLKELTDVKRFINNHSINAKTNVEVTNLETGEKKYKKPYGWIRSYKFED